MINIVLFGAPGCGKGTQAQRLKAHYGIEHVSTGEVIRDEIRRGTELGRSMESYIEAGKLAPDEIVIGMVANYSPSTNMPRAVSSTASPAPRYRPRSSTSSSPGTG